MRIVRVACLFIFSVNAFAFVQSDADFLIRKYRNLEVRPDSCPLQSTRYLDILEKTETIKNLFETNCLDSEQGVLGEILKGAKSIHEEMQKKGMLTTSDRPLVPLEVNGVKVSDMFTNINAVIKRGRCSLEDRRILDFSADLIQDFTQIGLLSPNNSAVTIAAGGFVTASILRLMDTFFKQRFNFEKVEDRQSFVKLNCAFYDIRKDIEDSGLYDVKTVESESHFDLVNSVLSDIFTEKSKLNIGLDDLSKSFSHFEEEKLNQIIPEIHRFKRISESLLEKVETKESDFHQIRKLEVISLFLKNAPSILESLNFYLKSNRVSLPVMDQLYLDQMTIFTVANKDKLEELIKMKDSEFYSNVFSPIVFNLKRNIQEISFIELDVVNQTLKEKKEQQTKMNQRLSDLLELEENLKVVQSRLERIVGKKEYSSKDDATESIVNITENIRKISGEIYGKWGSEFLSYTANKGYKEIKNFKSMYERFENEYVHRINVDDKNDLSLKYLCQDALRLRQNFKFADSLIQQAYDFVSANKDIIHTDEKSYYGARLDEEKNYDLIMSDVEKIQRHYRSAMYAQLMLKGEQVEDSIKDDYFSKTVFGNVYLGRVMIDLSRVRSNAGIVQETIEKNQCSKLMVEDI